MDAGDFPFVIDGIPRRIGAKTKEWQARGFIACDGNDPGGQRVSGS